VNLLEIVTALTAIFVFVCLSFVLLRADEI
jgi:hypothetical protein